MFFLSILTLFMITLQCVVMLIPSVKEDMFSIAAKDVDINWKTFKLKHSRSFKNKSEENRRLITLLFLI